MLALDLLEDLFAVHGDVPWGVDPDPYLVSFHTQDADGDVITNHQRLSNSTSQNQHDASYDQFSHVTRWSTLQALARAAFFSVSSLKQDVDPTKVAQAPRSLKICKFSDAL
jgi:hypothetical protein